MTRTAADISTVLDRFHRAAAEADGETCFALLAPEAVFIGTDATERWPRAAFEVFARPYFQRDSAWVYTPIERHITVAASGEIAWFYERLSHARHGQTRSSGVVERGPIGWQIRQYVLSFAVPNIAAAAVVAVITEQT